jgi:pyridoxal phosphate enzyme (YggS family)
MSPGERLREIKSSLPPGVTLIAVTKTHPVELIRDAYLSGHSIFGENRVQELVQKQQILPRDIQWHLIGHLQTNKVKEIAPFIHLIHSIDSLKLLREVDRQAEKCGRVIDCLLQLYIASEETKFGLDFQEAVALIQSPEFHSLRHIRITGLMGMSTLTDNPDQIRKEFRNLRVFFEKLKNEFPKTSNFLPEILSMGMSNDYKMAIEEGSTMIRVGSAIFGGR